MRDRTYRGRPVAALPASPQRLINRLADKVVSAQELCSSSWAVRGETAALRAHPTQQCPPVDSPQQWPPPYGTCRARIRRVHDARCAGGERAAKDCHTWHAVREVHGVRATVKSELLMAAPRLQRCEVKWASVVTIVVEAVGHSYRTSKDNTDGESELLMQETWSTTTWLRMRSLWSRLVVFGGVADLPLSEHTGALLLHAMQTSMQRRPTYARRIMNTLQKVGERHHGLTLMDAALGASSALPPLQQATPLSGSDLLSVCAAAARVEGGASMGRGPAPRPTAHTTTICSALCARALAQFLVAAGGGRQSGVGALVHPVLRVRGSRPGVGRGGPPRSTHPTRSEPAAAGNSTATDPPSYPILGVSQYATAPKKAVPHTTRGRSCCPLYCRDGGMGVGACRATLAGAAASHPAEARPSTPISCRSGERPSPCRCWGWRQCALPRVWWRDEIREAATDAHPKGLVARPAVTQMVAAALACHPLCVRGDSPLAIT
ncbi:hypothetical protein MNV84_06453 [Leishmania braziliensis]|nr:hypothetical protein MNV84_06453 [Leishmania braziliensis]CAJ2478719.1 unnamed protein product [Leishmania braziliensis]